MDAIMIGMLLVILIGLLIFLYSAGKNNKYYEEGIAQVKCLNRYINSNNIAMLTYVGIDSDKIRQYENALATIETYEENKIKVTFNGHIAIYDDNMKFFNEWRFTFAE